MINSPASTVSNSNSNINSPKPVPTALYPSVTRKGNSRQFLISQPVMVPGRHSPEYVIPDSTDNPLMELVQESVTDDDDDSDYITVVDTDGSEMVAQSSPEPVIVEKSRKRNVRKNVSKPNPGIQLKVLKTMAPKPKMEMKRKPAAVINVNKDESNDFLVDLSR